MASQETKVAEEEVKAGTDGIGVAGIGVSYKSRYKR